ncbi:MAG: 1-(5-phosphoribosyl)-5-[(5-phosphoribosylamino)methylideneamino]imidazole-4-carboxamide isomerase [Candidatus Brocadiaceae bacterium]|nr:1-(5-phosphoribosyl)-5-[(5-phosphoribosylamino)methylideneamino]imidazole-4-carboxamide isomerase [Candidatus Brocadiaceae bacterium]
MLVYPAVDIARGKCVRLLQGRPSDATVYYDSPLEAARKWQGSGARVLHVVDLDGALGSPGAGWDAVREILHGISLPVQVAGGLRTTEAVERVLEAGAARAVVGTRAVRDPAWAARLCGRLPGRVVIAVEAREGHVAVEGWQEVVGEDPLDLARRLAEAAPAAFLYTDVSRDGMLTHPNFQGVEALRKAVDVPIIASGGVASTHDIRMLGACGADAVIVGKAFYEEHMSMADALAAASRYPSRLPAAPDAAANSGADSQTGDL